VGAKVMDNSYLAGFLDGEGHVSIRLRKRKDKPITRAATYDIEVQVGQKIIAPLEAIQAVYGGHLRLRSPKTNPCWLLTWTSRADVMRILMAVEPHIIGKRATVLEALALLKRLKQGRKKTS
jgi:hypothetical protein